MTGGTLSARRRPTRRRHRAQRLGRAGNLLRPPTPHVSALEAATMLIVATSVAFFRLGIDATRGPVWAEDGPVFLQQAQSTNLLTGVLSPYAGYAHVLPRIQAELVSWLPIGSQGVAICLTAAMTQAAVAFVVWSMVRAQVPEHRLAAWLAALSVVAVPVGHETVDNIANDQWFLLVGASAAALWSPAGWGGRGLSVVVVVAAALSCPFGFVPVASAVLVWVVTRQRGALWLAVCGGGGCMVQAFVIATAPPRPQAPPAALDQVALGYARRVAADGVLGTMRHGGDPSTAITSGVVVLLLVLCVALLLILTARRMATLVPFYLVGLSVVLYVVPLAISGVPTTDSDEYGRYYVAPVSLLLASVVILASRTWEGIPGEVSNDHVTARRSWASASWVARVIATGLVVVSVVGSSSSWRLPPTDPRYSYPGWSTELDTAREACSGRPPEAAQSVAISPPGWVLSLPCRVVTGR